MRIAFFGGSFDPPHRGHLAIARAAARRLALDRVWMAPVGAQPLKLDEFPTSYSDRLAMVRLAVEGDPTIEASTIDAPRSDGRPNYTIDVLTAIRSALQSGDKLFFLLGVDALLSLKQWHSAAELPFLCEFVVAGRPGFSVGDLHVALPAGITADHEMGGERDDLITWMLRNGSGEQSRLYLMPDLHEDISATHIRAALADEESADGVLSPAVLRYIREKSLYQ